PAAPASARPCDPTGAPREPSPTMPPVTKSSLRPRLLNGQTGDPALLVSLRWPGRAILVDLRRLDPPAGAVLRPTLVDLGRSDRTPGAVLLPIEAVFVSHAHMDHFMGFDQLLRLFLARDGTLRLFGPVGIADCVQGKLAGYTWNLTDEYAFTLEVNAIDATEMRLLRFAAAQRFAREPLGTQPFTGVCLRGGLLPLEGAAL